ncbi:YolD-like protein [Paenibacillus sp. cl141a]|uniref:YolD-like family protein n=1 Tax=Paenibacillus sp. cl141a TaxID=1761877 RepID=UPI0008CD52DC|nr:YolD-like family protein [Paenibacillus sp. cl141a]SEM37109.1 YolD-like protein [Paenibacillus sp. cl141a]
MKKLTENGLWESSRMMLFEHRDAILEKQGEKHKQTHPLLDEQQVQWIIEKISTAYRSKETIQLQVYGEYGNYAVNGRISRINTLNERLLVGDTWINLVDILEVETAETCD